MNKIWWAAILLATACTGSDSGADDKVESETDADADADADSDSDSDSDSDADSDADSDTGGTASSDRRAAYIDCVGTFTTTLQPAVSTYTYNGEGFLSSLATDSDGNGSTDFETTYTWTVDTATGLPTRQEWTDGSRMGFVDYDAWGWPLTSVSDLGFGTSTLVYVNTYDAADLIIEAEITDTDLGTITGNWFDGCESLDTIESPDGLGGVSTTNLAWTYASGCTPSESVQTSNWSAEVFTTTYADGRPASSTAVDGPQDWMGTWAWVCP